MDQPNHRGAETETDEARRKEAKRLERKEERRREHPVRSAIVEGAIAAEKQEGRHEETDRGAALTLLAKIGYTIGGTVVIILGVIMAPLPGPGWLVIAIGFSILPFRWSKRVVREIRKRIPGVPEHGTVPVSTWIIGGLLMVSMTVISVFWGDDIWAWIRDLVWNTRR